MHAPAALGPGARVALIAPSGPLAPAADFDTAIANAESFGWTATLGRNARLSAGYLAGSDSERLSDLNDALRDPHVDAIWCLRGGYGAMRILDGIDADAMRKRPRAVIGYSDVTALHSLFNTQCGLVTYHGPTARMTLTELARTSLERAVVQQSNSCGMAPDAQTLVKGRAQGRLVGGNLSLLASLAGTPYAPDYANAILVIEDVTEPTYRIDRMFTQLALAGALSNLAGIAFGQFTEGDENTALEALLADVARTANVPAIAGIPLGHIDDQWTIPLGATAELDSDNLSLNVVTQQRNDQ